MVGLPFILDRFLKIDERFIPAGLDFPREGKSGHRERDARCQGDSPITHAQLALLPFRAWGFAMLRKPSFGFLR